MNKPKANIWPEEVFLVAGDGKKLMPMAYSSIAGVGDCFHGRQVAVYRFVGRCRLNVAKALLSDVVLPDKRKRKTK